MNVRSAFNWLESALERTTDSIVLSGETLEYEENSNVVVLLALLDVVCMYKAAMLTLEALTVSEKMAVIVGNDEFILIDTVTR